MLANVEFSYWDDHTKHGGICFRTQDDQYDETMLANDAVFLVLENAGYHPFHQAGSGIQPGFHAWEQWRVTRERADQEIPLLLDQVRERYTHLAQRYCADLGTGVA
jgi:hypothetical protein